MLKTVNSKFLDWEDTLNELRPVHTTRFVYKILLYYYAETKEIIYESLNLIIFVYDLSHCVDGSLLEIIES